MIVMLKQLLFEEKCIIIATRDKVMTLERSLIYAYEIIMLFM
jgi:hypothetical protein